MSQFPSFGPQKPRTRGRDRERERERENSEKNLDVMLMGATRGVFTAIEKMGKSNGGKGGRIINVASVAGLTVQILNFQK